MYQYQDQKEMRRALNGKMIVMLVGIMLVMISSDIQPVLRYTVLVNGRNGGQGE